MSDWEQQIETSLEHWNDPKWHERYWWLLNECIENRCEQNGIDPETIRYDFRDVVENPEAGTVVLFAKGHFATLGGGVE